MKSEIAHDPAEARPDHLCVLVHGLWGKPEHLSYVASAVRERYDPSTLDILVAEANSGSNTYDGIELGGERVTQEIESHLENREGQGRPIKKISIVGYSLGGLISRYAIGLLHSKGWFNRLQPVNFTTFATPHLGVRTPHRGFHNHVWNVLGARTLSNSGKQLFTIDSFRDTGRPLLSILADPSSIFIHGLREFKNRSLYANVVNDKSTVFYTAGISRVDPFENLEDFECNYLPGYDDVIVDPVNPISVKVLQHVPSAFDRFVGRGASMVTSLPLALLIAVAVPVGITAFLLNSVLQTYRSSRRIKLHEAGKSRVGIRSYRIPLIVDDVQEAVETVIENSQSLVRPEHLPADCEQGFGQQMDGSGVQVNTKPGNTLPSHLQEQPNSAVPERSETDTRERKVRYLKPELRTLALSPLQFKMIDTLEQLFKKRYPVYIHKARHSHAAIIYRRSGEKFNEGFVVVRHWLDTGFEV